MTDPTRDHAPHGCAVLVRNGCATAVASFGPRFGHTREQAVAWLSEHLLGRELVVFDDHADAVATYGDHFLCDGRHE